MNFINTSVKNCSQLNCYKKIGLLKTVQTLGAENVDRRSQEKLSVCSAGIPCVLLGSRWWLSGLYYDGRWNLGTYLITHLRISDSLYNCAHTYSPTLTNSENIKKLIIKLKNHGNHLPEQEGSLFSPDSSAFSPKFCSSVYCLPEWIILHFLFKSIANYISWVKYYHKISVILGKWHCYSFFRYVAFRECWQHLRF